MKSPSACLSVESLNGCSSLTIDPHFQTTEEYDFKYIEKTVYRLAESTCPLGHDVKTALTVIEEAYKRYGYEALSLSFNGGKDCTVLLHLVAAVVSKLGFLDRPLPTVFVTYPNPFPHVDSFVKACIRRYYLDCVYIPGPMKQALQQYIDSRNPKPRAMFVGIRRNDPYASQLTHFDTTDKDWPSFMRVHPIIDWSYKHIWDFLLHLQIPYCSLYDQGYTSLGSMENTHQNPDLMIDNHRYQPAYKLENELHERYGRMGTSKK
ncbi:hypothetical protein BDB01DRAFT_791222 [Pilobolus umbonatus]|nr:hypothetical protein BDB01DRAFT_791222 [Pilobolus umbonatus]